MVYCTRSDFGLSPDSIITACAVWLGFLLFAPTYHIGTMIGIPHGNWFWGPMEILVNTLLFFLIGGILGASTRAIAKWKKTNRRL
jgi:hypothetical protein